MLVMVVYDISVEGEGAKVQRNIYKACISYLRSFQKSAFIGEITEKQKDRLVDKLDAIARDKEDVVDIFYTDYPNNVNRLTLGIKRKGTDNII